MSNRNLQDMVYTGEELKEADKGGGFTLTPPTDVARKKGVAKWTEMAKVIDAYSEDTVGKEGQNRLLVTIAFKIVSGGDTANNVGRTHSLFLRLNPGFVNKGRQQDLGGGNADKETTMHRMAMKIVKQIIAGVGLDVAAGLTAETAGALFPDAARSSESILIGQSFALMVKDDETNKNEYSGDNNQNITDVLKVQSNG